MKKTLLYLASLLHLISLADEESETDMSFNELAKISIATESSLFDIERQKTPASVTYITREMIDLSGAKNLNELFRIFVPSFQTLNNDLFGDNSVPHIRGNQTGANRYVYLVNGVVMNLYNVFGPYTERELALLSDIESIEFIRGPGASIHGFGAMNGVISIKTYNSDNYEGTKITLKKGFVDNYSSLELRHAEYDDENEWGWSIYYGIDYSRGMNADNSPYFTSIDDPAFGIEAHKGNSDALPNYGMAARDLPRHKLHLEFNSEHWTNWLRFTRGGNTGRQLYSDYMKNWGFTKTDERFPSWTAAYQQITWHTEYQEKLNKYWHHQTSLTYNLTDLAVWRDNRLYTDPDRDFRANTREDKLFLKSLWTLNLNDAHTLGFGYEFLWQEQGQPSLAFLDGEPMVQQSLRELRDQWITQTHSVFMEHQWLINDSWTLFTGVRGDKHPYTDLLASPRLALIYEYDENNIYKAIFNRTHNRLPETFLRAFDNEGDKATGDTLNFYEFLYSHLFSQQLKLNLSAYYGDQFVVNFRPPRTGGSSRVGSKSQLEYAGIELELSYHKDSWLVEFSHSYARLINHKLENRTDDTNLSAEAYGYSSYANAISPHNTKLYFNYNINERLDFYSSLIIEWHLTGSEDFARYNNAQVSPNPRLPITNGSTDAFDPNYSLNLGIRYTYDENSSFNFDIHNALGWIDSHYNKRNTQTPVSDYYEIEPSISIQYNYEF